MQSEWKEENEGDWRRRKRLLTVDVRKEFRDHRNAKKDFIPVFMAEWIKYCDDLESQGLGKVSGR